jgi:hypothetical protein
VGLVVPDTQLGCAIHSLGLELTVRSENSDGKALGERLVLVSGMRISGKYVGRRHLPDRRLAWV